MARIYDVIVVGAGPAGSVLAYLLARDGLRVLLLERARLPRYKPCGGGITWKTVRSLPYDIQPVVDCVPQEGQLTYRGRLMRQVKLSSPVAYLVMRDQFDNFLVRQAAQAGVEVMDGLAFISFSECHAGLQVLTSAGSFSSRILVGADGVTSRVARQVGLLPNRRVGVALEAEVEVPGDVLAQEASVVNFDFGALPGGYGWIFPKRDHLSVGVYHAQSSRFSQLRSAFERWLDAQPALRQRRLVHLQGHLIPSGGPIGRLHEGRVILVGDAANLADPWLGEGIAYAIASAQIAAPLLAQAAQNGMNDLSAYSRQVRRQMSGWFTHARLLFNLVYRHPYFCSRIVRRSDTLMNMIFELLRGDLTFSQLTWQIIKKMPGLVYEVLHAKWNAHENKN